MATTEVFAEFWKPLPLAAIGLLAELREAVLARNPRRAIVAFAARGQEKDAIRRTESGG